MSTRLLIVTVAIALGCTSNSAGQKLDGCTGGGGTATRELTSGYRLVVGPAQGSCPDQSDEFTCKAELFAPNGKSIATMCDHATIKEWASEMDIDGDTRPEFIVETYSGGAHCCSTYWIVKRGLDAGIIAKIYNQTPARFEPGPGGAEVFTRDGAFDYFEFSHAENVMPDMFLRLKGGVWIDTSAKHIRHYDKLISAARQQLTRKAVARLRAVPDSDQMVDEELVPTRRSALTVVLGYLYSGREPQAWEALRTYWPKWDYARIKAAIEKTRAGGLTTIVNTNGLD